MQLPVFLTLILFSSNIISKPNIGKYKEEKTRHGAKVNSLTNKAEWIGRKQPPWIEKITPPPYAWPHYEPYLQYEDGFIWNGYVSYLPRKITTTFPPIFLGGNRNFQTKCAGQNCFEKFQQRIRKPLPIVEDSDLFDIQRSKNYYRFNPPPII